MDARIGRRMTAEKIRLLGNADAMLFLRALSPGGVVRAAPPITLRGIFNRFHVETSFSDGGPISVRRPTLFIDLNDPRIPTGQIPRKGDQVQLVGPLDVGGWELGEDARPDGIGGALLMLTGRDDDVSLLP